MNVLPIAVRLILAGLAALSGGAVAQDFPARPIRILIPFPAGSAADMIARLLATDMGGTLGTSLVVESRPGASGNIALDAAAKSPPDGYTVVLASASIAINRSLIKATPYDPQKDFTPISLVAMVPSVLVVSKALPANTVAELVAHARANPAALNYGTTGIGTTQHLAATMFSVRTGAPLTHVPYKGADQLVPDLVGGRIQLSFNNIPSVQGQLKAGSIRALAVGRASRWPGLPQVPTYVEAGIGGLEYSGWVALFGPAGMAPQVQEKLNRAVLSALASSQVRERIQAGGSDPSGGTPAALAAFLASEIDQLSKAAAAAGLKPE
ncbi:MAG: tripartite tricarboxylate transporter substrate binding protein [Burkholderiales bacterium]|nr:tripartite tricarboxylate transporter substrate binding protein [Burkholderiales bacterium]